MIAIRHLIRTHENVDNQLPLEIKQIEDVAKNHQCAIMRTYASNEWVDKLHSSCYQDAALSMSAVGMLAPLMESLFCQAFKGIHKELFTKEEQDQIMGLRLELDESERWDCHFVWSKKSGRKENLVRGILQLSKSTGLLNFLPKDIRQILNVLFAYRNKMFHCGFEWPKDDRERFWKRIDKDKWPPNWLAAAKSGDEIWMIYLTSEFIWECVSTIEEIINSFGQFVCDTKGIVISESD